MKHILCLLIFLMAQPALANRSQYTCNGQFAGTPLQGQLVIEYLSYSRTYGHYGAFFDGAGNRYDIEVISNQNGGVGGAWVNGARHREARIEMRYSGNRMVIVNMDTGERGEFTCS